MLAAFKRHDADFDGLLSSRSFEVVVRKLGEIPGRFLLGGGTGAVNEPLVIDVLQPARGAQEEALTVAEPVRRGTPEEVPREQLAYLPMLAG